MSELDPHTAPVEGGEVNGAKSVDGAETPVQPGEADVLVAVGQAQPVTEGQAVAESTPTQAEDQVVGEVSEAKVAGRGVNRNYWFRGTPKGGGSAAGVLHNGGVAPPSASYGRY